MSKIKVYRYDVSGRGTFPVDMLRYDSCWPEDTNSALKMAGCIASRSLETTTVRIRSHNAPTVGRWNSFGWTVSNEDVFSG